MDQYFLYTVGFSQSGKSTLVKKIIKTFPKRFVVIDSNTIQDFLNTTYFPFRDNLTISGKSYQMRQEMVRAIQFHLIRLLLNNGYSILYDACNLEKKKRTSLRKLVREVNPAIIINLIHVATPATQLVKNLTRADRAKRRRGQAPAWADLYTTIQKKHYQRPTRAEADIVLPYRGDDDARFFHRLDRILTRP